MITIETATVLALRMVGAERGSHFGNVDFRVRGKIFASFPHPDEMTPRLDPEQARVLVEAEPETYLPHGGANGQPGLDARHAVAGFRG